jgi:hypothetical protein
MTKVHQVVVYQRATGRIISSGETCRPELLEQGGDVVLMGASASPENDYVLNGRIVSKGPRPTPHHEFDFQTKSWRDMRTKESQWAAVRAERDRLLAKTDWTQMPDVSIESKTMWATYRQALRDITQQADPFNITWPTPPT